MKRAVAYLIAGLLCVSLSSPLSAIEKKKKEPSGSKSDTAQRAPAAEPKDNQAKKADSLSKKISTPPVFDSFIDANGNGVDDRLEKGGVIEKKKPSVNPPSPPVKKVAEPKPPVEKRQPEKGTKKSK